MEVKLYRKFVKQACKVLRVSRKQLFSRDFNDDCVLKCCKFNCTTKKLEDDPTRLVVLNPTKPLSALWKACDGHSRWVFKYWRHSHWKPYVQTKIDLGFKEDEVLASICQEARSVSA